MSSKKVSALTAVASVVGTDIVVVNDSGPATKKATVTQLTAVAVAAAATDATTKANAAQAAAIAAAATDATTKANAAAAASQPLDSDLTALAALTTTSFGRSFLDRADAAASRTYLGLGTAATAASTSFDAVGAAATAQAVAIGTASSDATTKANAAAAASQPLDSDLTAISALTTTSFGRSFLDRADAAASRTYLGLGSAALSATSAFDAAGAAAAVTAATLAASCITALDANHIHAWELTDASGNFVDTGSGTLVNLTATGTPLYAAPGLLGACAVFGVDAAGVANSSYGTALVSAFSDLPTTACTMEAWYCPYLISAGASIVGAWDTANAINCAIDAASGTSIEQTVRATSFKNGASTGVWNVFVPVIWHHVALTYDVATGFCLLYVDGEIVQKQTGQAGSISWSNGTTPSFRIGVRGTVSNPWVGKLSRVRISNIARTQSYLRGVYQKAMGF